MRDKVAVNQYMISPRMSVMKILEEFVGGRCEGGI